MKILVIYNPQAGQSQYKFHTFVHFLEKASAYVVVREIHPDRPLFSLLFDVKNFDRVVAIGGDGTHSSVVYALRGTGIPVAAYPAGTANLLALNLKMPNRPEQIARIVLEGKTISTDLVQIEAKDKNGEPFSSGFVIMGGIGFDAALIERSHHFKKEFGVGAYFLSALHHLHPRVAKFQLELDGEKKISLEGIGVLMINFSKIQFDIHVIPDSSPFDAKMDIVLLKMRDAIGLIPTLWSALLDRLGFSRLDVSSHIEVHRVSSVRIECDPPSQLQIDGDLKEAFTPLKAVIIPKAATLVVPSDFAS